MKHFAPYALVLLLCVISIKGLGQAPSKPKLFSNSPAVISCQESDLTGVFSAAPGQNVNLVFPNGFSFSGTVISNENKYNNMLQTVTVRSAVLDNTIFTITKRMDVDRNGTYTGRIINLKYFDGYELKKNAAGEYQLTKIETDRVVQPCSQ